MLTNKQIARTKLPKQRRRQGQEGEKQGRGGGGMESVALDPRQVAAVPKSWMGGRGPAEESIAMSAEKFGYYH